jgi:glycerate 2-kinase
MKPSVPPQVALLQELYQACLSAADPLKTLPRWLPEPPKGRTVVVGVGKAGASMALAVERAWGGPISGVVAVPKGATLDLKFIEQVEGSHPVPDESSLRAGQQLMRAVTGLGPEDLVIALISGGGSALSSLPVPGLALAEKQAITSELLLCGATIHEINTVRKHLSGIKGGRLAAQAYPARVVSLLISDIPGDDPTLIASGPTLEDSTTCEDALGILHRHNIAVSEGVREGLETGRFESPKPKDARFYRNTHHVIASAATGLAAAADLARQKGWAVHVLSDAMEGQARELALAHAAIAKHVQAANAPFVAPCVILSGGEATVTVKGSGRGGRNTEFMLALALALKEKAGIHGVSVGTDGLDGKGAAAGAWVAPGTLRHALELGLSPEAHLANNDSYSFFDAIGTTVVTGPTFTNINDFRGLVIEPTPR